MIKKNFRVVAWLLVTTFLVATLLLSGCSSQGVRIVRFERGDSFSNGPLRIRARPGHDIVLIEIETDENVFPKSGLYLTFDRDGYLTNAIPSGGGDLVVLDDAGKRYPLMGFLGRDYIFEVAETSEKLTLVVKGTIVVPLRATSPWLYIVVIATVVVVIVGATLVYIRKTKKRAKAN